MVRFIAIPVESIGGQTFIVTHINKDTELSLAIEQL